MPVNELGNTDADYMAIFLQVVSVKPAFERMTTESVPRLSGADAHGSGVRSGVGHNLCWL